VLTVTVDFATTDPMTRSCVESASATSTVTDLPFVISKLAEVAG